MSGQVEAYVRKTVKGIVLATFQDGNVASFRKDEIGEFPCFVRDRLARQGWYQGPVPSRLWEGIRFDSIR